mmetsp:Transcript_477/g.719  ORF Transcript_477/g.719 Transcript_477/m.719 type:complete len:202 (+) Transcript_477:741-1346(+)
MFKKTFLTHFNGGTKVSFLLVCLRSSSERLCSIFKRCAIAFTDFNSLKTCCNTFIILFAGKVYGRLVIDKGHVRWIECDSLIIGSNCFIKFLAFIKIISLFLCSDSGLLIFLCLALVFLCLDFLGSQVGYIFDLHWFWLGFRKRRRIVVTFSFHLIFLFLPEFIAGLHLHALRSQNNLKHFHNPRIAEHGRKLIRIRLKCV